MTDNPGLVEPPSEQFRITRTIDPLAYSKVGAIEASVSTAGNRFDVPGGGVLYTATTVATCVDEVLARMRPAPGMQNFDFTEDANAGFVVGLPADWREQRRIYTLAVTSELPFVNIDDEASWRWLERHAPVALLEAQAKHIDREHIYSSNRRVTRALATAIYTAVDRDRLPRFGGIRYESRLERGECWAIFDERPNVRVEQVRAAQMSTSTPELVAWARKWDTTIH